MADTHYVSTTQVAQALGVSVTTVKRWVDEQILPAQKTPGGHRKLLLADVLRLVKENHFPHQDLAQLGVAGEQSASPNVARLQEDLYSALRRGDQAGTNTAMRTAYVAGLPIEVLGDDMVAPALAHIGSDWEAGRIDILHEHRASQLCLAALYELKAQLRGLDDASRPVAVGGAPEDDPASVPSLLAQMVLLDVGWDAVNLGPFTPATSFRRALKELRPRLLWVSVCHALPDPERFLREYAELYRECVELKVAVAVGGRGLTPAIRSAMLYTTFGDGLKHLAAFARNLHVSSRRPRRGRPPRDQAPAG